MRLLLVAEHAQDNAEERDGERGDKKGQRLGGPEQADKGEHGQAVLLLGLLHDGHEEEREEDGDDGDEHEGRRGDKPRGQREAAQRGGDLLGRQHDLVVALAPRQLGVGLAAEDGVAEGGSLGPALQADELSPDRVPLPDDVLSQVRPQVADGRVGVSVRDDGAVGIHHPGNALLQGLCGVGAEGIGGVDKGVHVLGPQLAVDDLVVLLEHLAEARPVQLHVRLELAELDVEVDQPLLEHDARREDGCLLGVVVVGRAVSPPRPRKLRRRRHVRRRRHRALPRPAPPEAAPPLLTRQTSLLVLALVVAVVHAILGGLPAPRALAAVADAAIPLAGPGTRPGVVGDARALLEVGDVPEEHLDLVEQLLLLDGIERGDLLELDVEGAAENSVGILILEERARLGVAAGQVDGLLELVDAGGQGMSSARKCTQRREQAYSFLRLL